MAYNNEQNDPRVPINNAEIRSSSDLVPRFFRTNANKKFLNATIDQLIQPGAVKKINGYIGRSNTKSAISTDIQVEAADKIRQDYQLEPAAVIKDYLGNTTFYKDYIDHINHIQVFGGNVEDHSRLNKQEFYSWNPHIDWDKFVNFQQYYWLPYGPDVIRVSGQQKEITSTYTVDLVDEEDNYAYLFTPNSLTRNPTLRLFRGQTYIFEVNASGHPFSIKRKRTEGTLDRYNVGVSENSVEVGQIVFEVPKNAPDILFYVSENSADTGGILQILDIEENTFLDINSDIVGKKTYTIPDVLGNPLPFSNGMKVEFVGEVEPAEYKQGYWYVEGVGTAIKLISEKDLQVRSTYTEESILLFDDLPFDQMPFSEYGNLPSRKDYLTINRASPDNNTWSRFNRWFHKDVIEVSAKVNFKQPDLNQADRATRPIIEFVSGIKLYNHGTIAKKAVDVIDNFTKDAFSTVEGSIGYNVDGIDLVDGMRIIFNADTDKLVKNKIYRVNFIKVNVSGRSLLFNAETQIDLDTNNIVFTKEHGLSTGNRVTYLDKDNLPVPGLTNRQVYYVKTIDPFRIALFKDEKLTKIAELFNISSGTHAFEVYLGLRKQIHLTEESDAIPQNEDCVSINLGNNELLLNGRLKGNKGQTYWFNGEQWILAQPKLSVNQAPVFDVFDAEGNSFGDSSFYEGSSFKGNKIFSYLVGDGANDKELGFPLSYQNINNVGDIVFSFNLLTDSFEYISGDGNVTDKTTDVGYVKIVQDFNRHRFENGWTVSAIDDYQPVVRIYKGIEQVNDFAIDTFDRLDQLEDLKVKVYLNSKILKADIDYKVEIRAVYKYIVLSKDIKETDIITIKSYTKQKKNSKGYYEFPINLQNNPLNNNVETFTLGEVLNHVESIVENLDNFQGAFPGNNNLRDLGSVEKYGTRFVQHSGSLNLALYHFGSKNANIIKALDQSRNDYGKFKRSFLLEAEKSGFFGSARDHVNSVLQTLNSNKPKAHPYYLSDMFAFSANNLINYTVLDSRIKKYPLTTPFNLKTLSNKSVTLYLNGEQLCVNIDYLLGDDEFFEILVDLKENDVIEAVEWESTDGSFCPATPSKLGLYPAFEPKIYIDDTYVKEKESFSVSNNVRSFALSNVNKIVKPRDLQVFVDDELKTYLTDYQVVIQNGVYSVIFNQELSSKSVVDILIPIAVIQGHDGSITLAYNDYRDDLLLELEKRIFNNIKVQYNKEIFDILDYIPSYTRQTAYSRNEFNKVLAISFFNWIQLVGKDFTKNIGFDKFNSFTYHLNGTYAVNGTDIPKYWRGLYQWFFDTDTPHITPWECLGFSIKPGWWEEVYGPAPYTQDNQILWSDIQHGIIREPNKLLIRNNKLAKSILEYGPPVDANGKLLPPTSTNYLKGYLISIEESEFSIGDGGPVESAWQKSSYYPFALIRTFLLLAPSDVLGKTFDRSRIVLNPAKQLVYSHTGLRLRLSDILVPSTANSGSDNRVMTAGLVNYIVDYLSSENLKKLTQYKTDLAYLTNNLSTRLGAFTSKPKYKILLDSKNPAATAGVFVPEENYRVELNVSSSIKRAAYSGVVITKLPQGFEIKGYDVENQYFITYPYRNNLRTISVGSLSESFLSWEENKTYVAGKIVRYQASYFRVKVTHTTGREFNPSFYAILSELPMTGGRTAILRKDWDFDNPISVPYNTVLESIQDVVDFMQGYGEHLKQEGFVFDEFNNNLSSVTDWITSIKEFLFWTTQNWAEGSVISLSPAANKLVYKSKNAVVDSVTDQFYDYLIFKVNGKKLEPEYINVYRKEETFELEPSNTSDGIYCAVLNLVQKEHVIIVDNNTIFNDVIYDPEAGFRQERLKVVGYVTVNWKGGFDIPGFLFDRINIMDWEPWTDYNLGDIVKYKEFYYSARTFLPGVESFNTADWYLIQEKLESRLLPNWDYRAEQFTDFYDLDTDNFDAGQQKVAQHLIGYQKRQYLENIINNDVSQYKFYQGMIAEKGTTNVLSKLFDVLSAKDKESLTFNEEWAIRVGDYGAVDAFDEVEMILDEAKFKVNPQPVEIVDGINPNLVDFVYRQRYSNLYIKPSFSFTKNIFKTIDKSSYLRTTGYVRSQDVLLSIDSLDELITYTDLEFKDGDYIHTAFEGSGWNVYRISFLNLTATALEYDQGQIKVYCNRAVPFSQGSYILFETSLSLGTGKCYKVIDVVDDYFVVESENAPDTLSNGIPVYGIDTQRISDIDNLAIFLNSKPETGEIVWTDKNKNNYWASYINNPVYSTGIIGNQDPKTDLRKGEHLSISQNGNICVVTSSEEVVVYEKSSTNNSWKSSNRFSLRNLTTSFTSFGSVVKLSKDGEWLAIAAPTGVPTTNDGIGFVYLYKRRRNGKYVLVLLPSTTSVKEFTESGSRDYGRNIAFSKTADGYMLAVSASLSEGQDVVYVYRNLDSNSEGEWELISTLEEETNNSKFGNSIEFSDIDNTLVVSAPDYSESVVDSGYGKIYVYKLLETYILSQSIQYGNDQTDPGNFGFSIAVSDDGNYIAASAILVDANEKINSGEVVIYKKAGDLYSSEPVQVLTSIQPEENEQFGYTLSFMNNDETLVIHSLNKGRSGTVDIYDKYNTKFVYGETLSNPSGETDNYGHSIVVGSNVVLVAAPNATDGTFSNSGRVYSYIKPAKKYSWELVYEQIPDVDVEKIKKVYLYNKRTSELVRYLDVVDVKQGKIPGIADQEIKFKTYYDPAIYSKGTAFVNVDDGLAWQNNHIGQIWWDLTRAKFIENGVGDLLYKSINWNVLYKTASIDIYEWVESDLLPSEWDELADTEEGLALGISGTSKYGDDVYSAKSYYDPIGQRVKNIYYYWVKNKKVTPNVEGRTLSASNVSNLIADPAGYGYPCLSFNGSNSFNLVNIEQFVEDKDIVLNIQQWLVDNRTNYHSEWKLISSTDSAIIPTYIEQKWFHSLVGKDESSRSVPDLSLPIKQRYGVEFRPRQSMFVNRIEPLKQLVNSVNQVLKNVLLSDTVNLSNLELKEAKPNEINCLWDSEIDSEKELRFVPEVNFKIPVLSPRVSNGKIVSIDILDGGYGYSRYRSYEVNINQDPIKWYGPDIVISGNGHNAKVKSIINEIGSIVGYEILNSGEGYTDNTLAIVRSKAVLVNHDSTAFGGWAIYSWNASLREWQKTKSQGYDVTRYWQYIDWYKEGYDQYTAIDYLLENTFQLLTTDIELNSTVKIKNVGFGGWSLLKKVNSVNTIDYTENFETIGRQNGTIEFLSNIYSPNKAYDDVLLDNTVYDTYPEEELRVILRTLRDDILIDKLRSDYVDLFLDSVKYVLKEQLFVDWVFKSSFIKATHNLGELTQRPNYKNDNLADFEDYISEVKPYRTKIREFVSSYSKLENTNSVITDFDLLPIIKENKTVVPITTHIVENQIISSEDSILSYPWKNWFDNLGFEVTEIVVIDPGEGYIGRPNIEIVGDQLSGGLPATAQAYTAKGSIRKIAVLTSGTRWIRQPQVKITGALKEGGRHGKAIAIIGNGVIRSNKLTINFDRISKTYQVTNLEEIETFSGAVVSGSRTQFPLKWSPNLESARYTVTVNGAEVLKNEYSLATVIKKINGTSRYSGQLTFKHPPLQGSVIAVNYCKNFDHLEAIDRINFFYNPKTGQLGKDPSQLMTGIDYGGVSIVGLDFKNTYGWDALPWVSEAWDAELFNYEDHVVTVSSSSQREFRLPYIPKEGEEITVYISKVDVSSYSKYLDPVRIDDINYPVVSPDNVIMKSFVGDGKTNIVVLPENANLEIYEDTSGVIYGDRIIFRKATSDGSVNPRDEDYDTVLTGGDLAYYTAKGVSADDIILDGDGFVTPMTSHAPEEVVPGQVMDSLAIKVYSRPTGGAPNIVFKTYYGDGVNTEFVIGQYFFNNSSIIVKVGNAVKVVDVDYIIDYQSNKIVLTTAPAVGETVSVISLNFGSSSLLDLDYFVSDGETTEYITRAVWSNFLNATVLVNGQVPVYEIFSTDKQYANSGEPWRSRVGIRLAAPPARGSIINYIIDRSDTEQTASIAKSEVINYGLSQTTYSLVNPVGVSLPLEPNVLIKSDSLILNGPSYTYFTMTDKNLSYKLMDSKYQDLAIDPTDIKIYIDGELKVIGKDYTIKISDPVPYYGVDTFDLIGGFGYKEGDVVELEGNTEIKAKFEVNLVNSNGSILAAELIDQGKYLDIMQAPFTVVGGTGTDASLTVEFRAVQDLSEYDIQIKKSRYKEGKKLVVGITKNADYEFDSPTSLTIKKLLHGINRLEVLSFYNHNILGIERTEEVFDQKPVLDPKSPEYYEFAGKVGGKFTLRSTVPSGDFVWVVKNRQMLSLGVDYYIEDDLRTIRLVEYPVSSDVIQIIAFTNTVVSDSFGFMQFKDMMNRTHFKRLNKNKATKLARDLNPFDRSIVVEDSSVLDFPDRMNNRPGIIEINGERIEYFVIDGNELSHLRRGTLGTGIAEVYLSGTVVQDIGFSETIPYKDTIDTVKLTSTGEQVYSLPYIANKDEIEVFVGGYRLKKNDYSLYTDRSYPDSPEGDSILPPEFEVYSEGGIGFIKLKSSPAAGIKIMIVRKQGWVWNDPDKRLANSNNLVANFIKETDAVWPR